MIGPRPVVITGASSGIGAACVKVLAQEGLTPIPMVRKDRDLDDLATQIGFRPFGLVADVTDRASLLAAADMLKAEIGSSWRLVRPGQQCGCGTAWSVDVSRF